mmetsp:Transcript_29445/g.48034  ORF Transcript_29445/g.48034 Transcript_29445/m.48034 type:complete len:145 (-) Transcript_29445:383-817(-)
MPLGLQFLDLVLCPRGCGGGGGPGGGGGGGGGGPLPCRAGCVDAACVGRRPAVAMACCIGQVPLSLGYGTTRPRAKLRAAEAALGRLRRWSSGDGSGPLLLLPGFAVARLLAAAENKKTTKAAAATMGKGEEEEEEKEEKHTAG